MKTIYTPNQGNDNKWYPCGPGTGLDYYSGMLFPDLRWESEKDVIPICKVANIAYNIGYEQA